MDRYRVSLPLPLPLPPPPIAPSLFLLHLRRRDCPFRSSLSISLPRTHLSPCPSRHFPRDDRPNSIYTRRRGVDGPDSVFHLCKRTLSTLLARTTTMMMMMMMMMMMTMMMMMMMMVVVVVVVVVMTTTTTRNRTAVSCRERHSRFYDPSARGVVRNFGILPCADVNLNPQSRDSFQRNIRRSHDFSNLVKKFSSTEFSPSSHAHRFQTALNIYTHIYICTNVHTYTHTRARAHTHTHPPPHTHIYTYMLYIYYYIYVYIMCTCVCLYIYIYIFIYSRGSSSIYLLVSTFPLTILSLYWEIFLQYSTVLGFMWLGTRTSGFTHRYSVVCH